MLWQFRAKRRYRHSLVERFEMCTGGRVSVGIVRVSRSEESSEMWLLFNYVCAKIAEVSVILSQHTLAWCVSNTNRSQRQ